MPQNIALRTEYERGWKITEIIQLIVIRMNSHRDFFAIAFDSLTLKQRYEDLASSHIPDEEVAGKYLLVNTSDFSLSKARSSLRKLKEKEQIIVSCLYRPFDYRYVFYHPDILDRPRMELNDHFVGKDNLGLVTTRQTREPFATLAVNKICGQQKIVATYDGSSIFPLYLYPNPKKDTLFDIDEPVNTPSG